MATNFRILFDQSDSGKIYQHFTNVDYLEKRSNDSVSVSPFSSLLLFSHMRVFRSLWLSVTLHVRMKDGSEAASHGERHGDKAEESLYGFGLGEPKVRFRLHQRASASSLCDPDLHNHQTPAQQWALYLSQMRLSWPTFGLLLMRWLLVVVIWTLTLTLGLFRWIQSGRVGSETWLQKIEWVEKPACC